MIIFFYLLVLAVLGVYSYSQIDLNLTLLQTPWFLSFQHLMIQLGYFNRLLSTAIFAGLLLLLFLFYLLLLRQKPNLFILVAGVVVLTLFAYPAFSHDFFNYLFDARIVTHYGQNPYFFKALDFPTDTWTRFMQWTHRTYPYGPIWLALTVPLSYLGFGKFILTVFNFKIMFAAAYVGSVVLIKKLSGVKNALFFAANPLVIIEGLVSPHLDAVMAFFFLFALYLLPRQRLLAMISVLLSGGVKFLTFVTLPFFFWPKKIVERSLVMLLLVLIPVIILREAYSWYFLPPLAVVALINNRTLWILAVATTFGLLLRYLPFLYLGQESLAPENLLTIVPVVLCGLGLTFYRRR